MITESVELHTRISSALRGNPHLSRREVLCETYNGRVILRGVVGSFFQKQMAQESLRRLDGIVEIENLLEVS